MPGPWVERCLFDPVSVREWCAHSGMAADQALLHLIERGGVPEPCLAERPEDVQRWLRQYVTDLIGEDVLKFFACMR